jgi:hypothetical protein
LSATLPRQPRSQGPRTRLGHFWLEQNPANASKWGKFAREAIGVAWEFGNPSGVHTGRMLIDGEIHTPAEATKKFFPPAEKK